MPRASRRPHSGLPTPATYDDQDRLVTYGSLRYTHHNEDGQLATKRDTTTGAVTRYAYDVLGNLRSVELPNGGEIEYLVDGAGHRVGKRVDGTIRERLLWGDLGPIAELDADGDVTSQFVYTGTSTTPEYVVRGGRTYRILSDERGSPRLVVDVDSGEVLSASTTTSSGACSATRHPASSRSGSPVGGATPTQACSASA
ncbi:MAG: hypothetical protein ABW167_04180 [Baekduia sp.]